MSRFLWLCALSIFVPFSPAGQSAPQSAPEPMPKVPAGYHQVKLNGHTFTLPEGFTIEVAADSTLAERPIVAAFDEQGRLYVCDSSGSNEPVKLQVEKKPHRVVRLEDTDGDGKFDKSTVFVKNVMFPEGAMWHQGSLYVAAPPHIWKFTDTNHDGVAEKEEIWFDGKTLTGCANDLHGPYLGPDGWIYWCKGAFAKQEYTLPNKKKFTTRASHIFRTKVDGSNLEPVMTGGMDNPVDTVFMPNGDRIFSTTFFQHPRDGKRDGLIHAVYGGIYGKDHDPIHEHPWTSPQLMPVLTHMGPAAPCGLHRYESDQFGKDYENNIFCCQFNLRKVSRHVLTVSGSSYAAKDSDFVVSDNLDFHPTDVIEDADGSLLIVDTGGWYKLCCPTSQLVKPDVKGAIYRVKKVGMHKIEDPRGLKIEWAKLNQVTITANFNNPRPAVRQHATELLRSRGATAVASPASALRNSADVNNPKKILPFFSDRGRIAAAWLLVGIDDVNARRAVHPFILDRQAEIRHIAIHGASLWRDTEAVPQLRKALQHEDLITRRLAAEALGRIGDIESVSAILKALAHEGNDRALDHALTYALIEIAEPARITEGLASTSPRVVRSVLAAMDAIGAGNDVQKVVLANLDAKDAALKETAWWIVGKHADWGEQLVQYFRSRVKSIEKMTLPEQDEFINRFTPLLKSEPIRKAYGEALESILDPRASRSLLRGMAQSGLKALPAEWTNGVLLALNSRTPETVRDALIVLRAVPPSEAQFTDISTKVEGYYKRLNTSLAKEHEYGLRAVAPLNSRMTVAAAESVIADVHRDRTGAVRAAAADLLSRVTLSPESLLRLAGMFKYANPVEVGKLLPPFAKSTDEKVGLALVAALSDPAVRGVVRIEVVQPILEKYPKSVKDEATKLYALLAEARKGELEKLEGILKEMPKGDIRRGQLVFNSAKGQCIACHKVGYVGGLIGPDLTRIGNIRSERDLLEAIIFPNASFVRSYEPSKVTTMDGRTFNGILKKDAPDEIILVLAADKEERIARGEIERINPGSISVMPSGFDQQMTIQELADLVAFLKACR